MKHVKQGCILRRVTTRKGKTIRPSMGREPEPPTLYCPNCKVKRTFRTFPRGLNTVNVCQACGAEVKQLDEESFAKTQAHAKLVSQLYADGYTPDWAGLPTHKPGGSK